MADFVLGVLAVLVGAVFCFRGQFVMRLVIPIWGAFSGFAFGAGLVSGFADESFLGTVLGWVLGLVFALVFGILAYLYYWFAIVLAMAAAGFALGSGVVVALGIDWNWVAALVGMMCGLLVGLGAVLIDMPMLVLVVLSGLGGAVVMVTGFMLITGAVNSADFTGQSFTDRVDDDWWWYVVAALLAMTGIFSQSLDRARLRLSMRDSMDSTWSASTF